MTFDEMVEAGRELMRVTKEKIRLKEIEPIVPDRPYKIVRAEDLDDYFSAMKAHQNNHKIWADMMNEKVGEWTQARQRVLDGFFYGAWIVFDYNGEFVAIKVTDSYNNPDITICNDANHMRAIKSW